MCRRKENTTGDADASSVVWARTGRAVLATLNEAGGVGELSASHEQVSAYHGGNYLPFLEKFYRRNRSTL